MSSLLTDEEKQKGELALIQEIRRKRLSDSSTYEKLKAQADIHGILRVKTTLMNMKDSEDFKRPLLLPSEDPYVHQLILHTHEKNCHAGAQTVLCLLREKYWIIKGRKTVTRVIQKCIICRRFSVKRTMPASLPTARVEGKFTFETTGVDLAGPILLKGGNKAWIVLYTCAVYRAVHLDIVDSISTEEFLQSLERFTWTCGRLNQIYSDKGTNFVGASNLMKKLDWEGIKSVSNTKMIIWKFNPPTAAWWGVGRMVGAPYPECKGLAKKNDRSSQTDQEAIVALFSCRHAHDQQPASHDTDRRFRRFAATDTFDVYERKSGQWSSRI